MYCRLIKVVLIASIAIDEQYFDKNSSSHATNKQQQ